jgi:hypothetical protein
MEQDDELKEFMEQFTKGEGPLAALGFLKELGLTEAQMQAILIKLPQAVNEFIQGRSQYVEEEKQLLSVRERVTRQISDLLMQNINASRNFFLTLATLSLTLLGAIASARATDHVFFKGVITLNVGMGFLGVCILVSVLYLLDRLTSENTNLTKSFQVQQAGMSELIDLMRSHAMEMKPYEEYAAAKKELIEKNQTVAVAMKEGVQKQSKFITFAPYVICLSFLTGLGFVAIAFWF